MIEYLTPATIDEAEELGSRGGAEYVGGGTWVNSRPLGEVRTLISLEALGLDGVRREGGSIRIGAATRFQNLLETEGLPEALAKAACQTASRTLRNMITIGGDLGLHEPASRMVAAVICLGGAVVLAGKKGEIGVEEYRKSKTGGLIVEVAIPDDGSASNLLSLSRTSHSRKTLVCAAAGSGKNGVLENLRIVAGDCVTHAARLTAVETALEGKAAPSKPEIEELVKSHFTPVGDFHAGADYKRYMAGVFVADIIHGFSFGGARS